MNFLITLLVARLLICSAFPTANTDGHRSFSVQIKPAAVGALASSPSPTASAVKSPSDETEGYDSVDGEDAASNKKFFADRFIHPSKLKHGSDKRGVVHVTVPSYSADDESLPGAETPTQRPHHHHHLYQPMPSKSKWVKAVMTTTLFTAAPTTQPPTQPPETTTTMRNAGLASGTSLSWLVDDWDEDDDDEDEETAASLPVNRPVAPPATEATSTTLATAPPIVSSPDYLAPIAKGPFDGHHPMHSFIFDIPTGSATDNPFAGAKAHAPSTIEPPMAPMPAEPLPASEPATPQRIHQSFEHQLGGDHVVRPAIISKPSTFSIPSGNLRLLNLHHNDSKPSFPGFHDGVMRPDNDIADHVEPDPILGGVGLETGGDVLASLGNRHFPPIEAKVSRIDEHGPYFHSKTDYLEMPHAFHTPDDTGAPDVNSDGSITTMEMPVIDDGLVLPNHSTGDTVSSFDTAPPADTFVLKIPAEGTGSSIVAADLVPVTSSMTEEFGKKAAKHSHSTSVPFHHPDEPYQPPTDFEGGVMPLVDESDSGPGWSEWTLKVPCSRTCGMGIEIFGRFCQAPGGCANGSTTRFKVCAQAVCPPSVGSPIAVDDPTPHGAATYSMLAYTSRMRQCAHYNNQPFDGLFYEWTPYYTTTGQCELFCLAKSANFYHKFGDQVEDGTACDPYSESSVCIKGKCHPVGCDNVVGSRLKRDRCGVCGGLNNSCNTFDGLVLSGDFTLGYHDIIKLPVGATNIFVHEMAPSINNLALHLESGEYVLNGDYHIGLSKKVFAGKVLFVYTHNDKQEESLYAEGPLTEPVVVAMLYQSDHVNIHYEYSLPKAGFDSSSSRVHGPTVFKPSLRTEQVAGVFDRQAKTFETFRPHHQPTTTVGMTATTPEAPMASKGAYAWLAGEWSACSVSCGIGTRLRVVTCIDSVTANVVSDHLCPAAIRLENVESCHLDTCTARWKVGEWSACSKTCGVTPGVQRRTVDCVEFAWPDLPIVDIKQCERLSHPKPPSEQQCDPPATNCPQWLVGEWSSCQSVCGDGNQTRSVSCSSANDTDCEPSEKPIARRRCHGRPCSFMVDWIVSAWSPCVDSCGGGVSTRKVRCATPKGQSQPSTFCRFKPRPSHLRKCQPNENLCRPRWTVGNWSNCSSPCGAGVQTRSVVCVHLQQEMPFALEDEYCHETRPESEQICNGSQCGYNWFIGPWTACSVTCGVGHRSRTVLCLDGEGAQVENANCPLESRPHQRQKCEAAIKHCSGNLKQQGETLSVSPSPSAPSSPVGVSSISQKAIQDSRGDCSVEDYGCCPDGITAATGPFNAGCPNTSCAESRYGCCPDSMVPALGSSGEGCPLVSVVNGDCAESMFGCCPDGLTPARGLDLRGCDGLCHDTRFGCCPDNIHPAAGVNFENCPGVNCTESQYGCCPDGVRPAPSADGKGCPSEDGSAENLTPAGDDESSMHSVHFVEQRKSAMESSEAGRFETTEEPTTTTTEMPTTSEPRSEENGGEVDDGDDDDDGDEEDDETTAAPTTETTTEEWTTEEPETTPFNPKVNEHHHTVAPEHHSCGSTEFGCCLDGETPARGRNMEGCPSSGDCLTSTHGCCDDGVTTASGPDGEGCSEAAGDDQEGGDDDDDDRDDEVEEHGSGTTASSAEDSTFISTPTVTERAEGTSIETDYIRSSGLRDDEEPTTTDERTQTQPMATTSEPAVETIRIDISDETTRSPDRSTEARVPTEEPSCRRSTYGCCPDDRTEAAGSNLEGCAVNCTSAYESGECDTHQLAWYYDAIHGVCARFWFSGCGGNTNRFVTEEHCKAKCVQPLSGFERCMLPGIRGPCNRHSDKDWHYFDASTMTCRPLEYGGCNGNNNRFESKKHCEDGCVEVVRREICSLPSVTGPCRASMRRWYFDSGENRCRQFVYGGCDGNANRFASGDECFSLCGGERPVVSSSSIDVRSGSPNRGGTPTTATAASKEKENRCSQPKTTGPCKAHIKRWFYDADTATCRQFVYGGCHANGNNFHTSDECTQTCGGKSEMHQETPLPTTTMSLAHKKRKGPMRANHPACLLAADPGPCKERQPRYHYIAERGVCESFWFGGCGGNQNNFPDEKHCESVCRPDGDYISGEVLEEEEDEDFSRDQTGHVDDAEDRDPTAKIVQEQLVRRQDASATTPPPTPAPLPADTTEYYGEDDPLDCLESWSYGDCDQHVEVWYYDQAALACVRGDYSGCGGTSNRFNSYAACHQTCIQSNADLSTPTHKTSSHRKKVTGSTTTAVPSPTAESLLVSSGGYLDDPSTNNRDLISQGTESCNLPRDVGTCSNSVLRYFYDETTDSCRPFFYSGCGGNSNNFANEVECLRTCARDSSGDKLTKLREVEDCFQLPDQGPCEGQVLRWYFDFEHDRRCKTFYYGGCGGAKNNFIAHDDCTAFCSQAKCPSLAKCALATTMGACPYGLLVDANGCELCQCHDPCEKTQCLTNEVCRVDQRDGKYVAICDPEPESDSCSESEFGCCPDGVTLSQMHDHSDCPEMPPEIVTQGPTDIEVAVGETVTLQCKARGSPAPEIIWYKNWHHISYSAELMSRLKRLPTGALQIPDVTANDSGNYTCRAHNSVDHDEDADEASTRTYHVVVRMPARISTRIDHQNVVAKLGSTIVIPCTAEGNPRPEIMWHFGDRMIKSDLPDVQQTPEGLRIGPVEARHIGLYKCTAENSNGRDERQMRVDMEASLRVRISAHNASYAVGGELTLTCEATGFPRPRLRWQKNSGHLKHATIVEQLSEMGAIAKLTIETLQISDSGNYICTANNGHEEERQQTAIRVKQSENELPTSCVDKPQFANCGLIVAARLCGHHSFAKFCCESCYKAGQLRQKMLPQ